MRGIEIRDGIKSSGFLGFDLAEILEALQPLAIGSTWQCRDLYATSREMINVLELEAAAESEDGIMMSNDELVAFASQLVQVIDGEFSATRPGESTPWLVVRAVDSSWWEIFSSHDSVFDAVRRRFTDLKYVDEVPQN